MQSAPHRIFINPRTILLPTFAWTYISVKGQRFYGRFATWVGLLLLRHCNNKIEIK
jgi:hypothetical protein